MDITANFRVEKIENGFVVEHKETRRKRHVPHEFEVARQVERFMHEDMVERLANQAALEADARATGAVMQQDEG